MEVESKELKEYVKSVITAIKTGVRETDFEIVKPIEFNLSITNARKKGSKLKIYVTKTGELKSQEINRIKFEVQPKPESPQPIINVTNFKP